MKTFLGDTIDDNIRGVLYLCNYDYKTGTIQVAMAAQFSSAFDALNAYANIPNPESQLATGGTSEELAVELDQLHKRLNDPVWVKDLANYL